MGSGKILFFNEARIFDVDVAKSGEATFKNKRCPFAPQPARLGGPPICGSWCPHWHIEERKSDNNLYVSLNCVSQKISILVNQVNKIS